MELWNSGKRPVLKFFCEGDHYQIPASSLKSKNYKNLFLCGRGISADENAISSARVIGTCLGTGTAAGHLAASYANSTSLEESILAIQKAENL